MVQQQWIQKSKRPLHKVHKWATNRKRVLLLDVERNMLELYHRSNLE